MEPLVGSQETEVGCARKLYATIPSSLNRFSICRARVDDRQIMTGGKRLEDLVLSRRGGAVDKDDLKVPARDERLRSQITKHHRQLALRRVERRDYGDLWPALVAPIIENVEWQV